MGTDIHSFIETRNANGVWTAALEPNSWYDSPAKRQEQAEEQIAEQLKLVNPSAEMIEAKIREMTEQGWFDTNEFSPVTAYTNRNYGLFAILADVRNGTGFAGVKTGEPTTPIDLPRGLPDDASEVYLAEVEHWGVDGHSHTYFTLAELLDHDWDGNYSINSYLAHPQGGWSREGKEELPADYDFDAFAIEAEKILAEGGTDALYARYPNLGMCGGVSGLHADQYRRVAWKETHRSQAGDFINFLEEQRQAAKEAGRELSDVRLCMFFDS